MSSVRIERFSIEMIGAASQTLARAFVTNPLHVAAFGPGQLAKNEAFFRRGLAALKGPMFVAVEDARILGLIHWVPSSDCQLSGVEKLRMLPGLVSRLGIGSAWRVSAWLSAWSKLDPRKAHSHLGPIGVDPRAQGQQVGRRLMEEFCNELDRRGDAGYLETDRPENVSFYRRFGFEITVEAPVLGVRNYFMWRKGLGPCLRPSR
jgi:ribosomal protein S18 acetylase RimI-like enzyme